MLTTEWRKKFCWVSVREKSKFKKFKSPEGKIHQARSLAIKEMIAKNCPGGDIEIMKKGLILDGWIEMEGFPKGWLKFITENGYTKFLTPDCQTIHAKPKDIKTAFLKYNLDKTLIPKLKEEYCK